MELNLNYFLYLGSRTLKEIETLLNTHTLTAEQLPYIVNRYRAEHNRRAELLNNLLNHPNQNLPDEIIAYMIDSLEGKDYSLTKHLREEDMPLTEVATNMLHHPNASKYTLNAYQKIWLKDKGQYGTREATPNDYFYEHFRQGNQSHRTFKRLLSNPKCSPTTNNKIAAMLIQANQPEEACKAAMQANINNITGHDILTETKTHNYSIRRALRTEMEENTNYFFQTHLSLVRNSNTPTPKQREQLRKALTALLTLTETINLTADRINSEETLNIELPTPEEITKRIANRIDRTLAYETSSPTLLDPELPKDYSVKLLLLEASETATKILQTEQNPSA